MTATDTTTELDPKDPDVVAEEEPMTLQEAGDILSENPMFAGAWNLMAPVVKSLSDLSEELRKATVTDAQVNEEIKTSEDPEVVKLRTAIEKLREQARAKQEALFAQVKQALKGDDMPEDEEKAKRDLFAKEKIKVSSMVGGYLNLVFSDGEPDLDESSEESVRRYNEYHALKTIQDATPSLRGVAVGYKRHMTGAGQATHVREWLKTNRPDLQLSTKGRIPIEYQNIHAENCQDCKDRVNGSKK